VLKDDKIKILYRTYTTAAIYIGVYLQNNLVTFSRAEAKALLALRWYYIQLAKMAAFTK
jgi:hypothetical protein